MAKAVELLVHAGAPSNVKDDERYKAQAEAYPEFQGIAVDARLAGSGSPGGASQQVKGFPPHQSYTSQRPGEADHGSDASSHLETTTATRDLDITHFLDDTQLALTVLESQIVSSNFRIEAAVHSPAAWNTTKRTSLTVQGDQHKDGVLTMKPLVPTDKAASCHLIPREGQDSSPVQSLLDQGTPSSYLKSPELDRPAKRLRRADYELQPDQTIRPSEPFVPVQEDGRLALGYVGNDVADHDENQAIVSGSSRQGNQNMSIDQITTSELPTTYSLSNITTDSSKAISHSMQRSVSDPGPVIISLSDDTPVSERDLGQDRSYPAREVHVPLSNVKDALKTIDLDADIVVTSSRTKEAVQSMHKTGKGPKVARPALVRPTDSPWLVELRGLPVSIQPPPPPTGISAFNTHITPTLRHLAESSPVATHYVPAEISREVRPLERGYWTFDANRMALEQQVKFWQYLQRLIGSGNIGWGVWCTRERDKTSGAGSNLLIGLGSVNVYCWGEIVKHVYLLLYVASQSKIRKLGLQWLDSDHCAVVQMRRT